ncbi:FAD-dependent oxidoreductase [Intrasporangium sp.]|uniref:FAD-dependent oxidoreductase n=1 Tax=Intrasporangium sp. TaxID=1925024 RepID=UPI0029396E47|nr:FAD-dependent oxidoreductase [Intrasporangium sp.]MDV3220621.1 FAD-dependent oxidoreductase [Intrasporangium sp.]
MPLSDRALEDVLIVGAGPAGLACAATLLEASDVHVTVVDAGAGPGGQYWRQPAPTADPHGVRPEALRGLHHDLDTFESLRARLEAGRSAGRATLLTDHHVWTVVADGGTFTVHAVDRTGGPGRDRAVEIRARHLVIATGAHDRSLPFPGWDLPGVMTAGGLQALLKSGDVTAGRRVALGGTGPFLLPVAAGLAARGATVVGVFEANSPRRWLRELGPVAANVAKLGEGIGYAAILLRHRVPVRARTMIVEAHGRDRVEAISVVRLDTAGRPTTEAPRRIEVDAVGVGWGFSPQLDLPVTLGCALDPDAVGTSVVRVDDWQRTSRPGIFAAGEACGVGGAALAVAEGHLTAYGIVHELTGSVPEAAATLRRTMARLHAFASAMHRAHPIPAGWAEALREDTVVCRCEEVTAGTVRRAISDRGAPDARQVKQLTRAGMGWCQGRVCGHAVELLSGAAPAAPPERLVSTPVPLGVLADDWDDFGAM